MLTTSAKADLNKALGFSGLLHPSQESLTEAGAGFTWIIAFLHQPCRECLVT